MIGAPVAMALPPLEAMLDSNGTAYADGEAIPTRFGVWFFGAGGYEQWVPAQTGDLVLPNGYEPLARHLPRVTMVSGLEFVSFGDFATNRHYMGASSVLAGVPPVADRPGGATLDQLVAAGWRGNGRTSLEISITDDDAISYNAANSPNQPTRDPRALMQLLFGGVSASEEQAARERSMKTMYLDAVKEDVTALTPKLGAQDKQRLASYLDGIHELQKSLQGQAACSAPAATTADISDATLQRDIGFEVVNRANSKLLAIALGCGLTRVFSYSLSAFNSSVWFPNGVANTHHELGHQAHDDLPKSMSFIAERFAETLDELAALDEGAGTVLDSTGIVMLTEVSWNHHNADLPIVIAGGGGGKLKGGQHVRSSGPSTRAGYTVARAMGASLASYGADEAYVDDEKVISDVLL
jgi:hypothetical protein